MIYECEMCGEIADSDELPQGWEVVSLISFMGMRWEETLCPTCKVRSSANRGPMPCPYCGHEIDRTLVSVDHIAGRWRFICQNPICDAKGPWRESRTAALIAWNTRLGER